MYIAQERYNNLKMDNYTSIKYSSNKAQMAQVLVDFWCQKCCWRSGRVPDCEEVCIQTIIEWLSKEKTK